MRSKFPLTLRAAGTEAGRPASAVQRVIMEVDMSETLAEERKVI